MKKENLVWLSIRLIGLYLAYNGVLSFITLLSSLALIGQMKSGQLTVPVVFQQMVLTAFHLGIGIYLLKDGVVVFDLINAEHPGSKVREELSDISIK